MTKYQARINTKFGQIILNFDTKDELEKALEEAAAFVDIISGNSAKLSVEMKTIRGFEDLCSIGADGVPRLLKHPAKKKDVVRLALFLASMPLDLKQLTEASGVANPLAYVGKEDLIKSVDGRYSLEAAARKHVLERVIPVLRVNESP